ncbi:MAG: chromo domain-containing protein, partial [Phycisphaerales bacterium]|nr:chromo domain-containing protein [Phycisphaerales bacterium]
MNEKSSWEKVLPTVEMVINSMPNSSTGFSPFYLNYGREPVMPVQLLDGKEGVSTESVDSFIRRVNADWTLARENLKRSVDVQQRYYNKKHRDVGYTAGDMVLLSTRNLKIKGIPGKLQKRFVGPFQVVETIGQQAYRLALPDTWKIHNVFHVSLLKRFNAASLQEDQPVTPEDAPEIEEPFYEVEKILRWRKVKKRNQIIKQYLVLWKGFPVEDAQWIQAEQFSHPGQLQSYLDEDQPLEEKL